MPTLLILAAGMGSRYGGPKQLDQIGPNNEIIIDYGVYDAIKSGFKKVVFVIRKSIEAEFKEVIGNRYDGKIAIDYAIQEVDVKIEGISTLPSREKPWGTAHAVMVAEEKIDGPFAVINADDFYGFNAYQTLANFFASIKSDSEYAMVGYELKNTLSDNGHVSRGVCEVSNNQHLTAVIERTQIEVKKGKPTFTEQGKDIVLDENTMVSMNFWGFQPSIFPIIRQLFKSFLKEKGQEPKSEFFIPLVADYIIKNKLGHISVLKSQDKWYGVTYKEDRPVVAAQFAQFVKEGRYPSSLF